MYTYQDFMDDCRVLGIPAALKKAIDTHTTSLVCKTALTADEYDHQQNTTILKYRKKIYTDTGAEMTDFTASNNQLCSNFFNRLNVQRLTYSLGNGIEMKNKEKLGKDIDTRLIKGAYYALIHGEVYGFWNVDHVHFFKVTEFAPLYDEETGAIRAGIRYWQIDQKKPLTAVLYEEDGFSKYRGKNELQLIEPKRAYKLRVVKAESDEEPEVIGEENYGVLPIIPFYGSRLQQSTLVGMRSKIDAYDLVSSGFANDLEDVAEIFWIISNAGGMTNADLSKFRDRLKLNHIANVEDSDGVSIAPYSQEVPTDARKIFLDQIRASIYEDFGGLDVHTIAAGATNDHIDAAYQPMDENADDFEMQIIEFIQAVLRLQGIDDVPLFKRNRISNQKELVDMIMECANVLDVETILRHLPFLTVDEIEEILARKAEEDTKRLLNMKVEDDEDDDDDEDEAEDEAT